VTAFWLSKTFCSQLFSGSGSHGSPDDALATGWRPEVRAQHALSSGRQCCAHARLEMPLSLEAGEPAFFAGLEKQTVVLRAAVTMKFSRHVWPPDPAAAGPAKLWGETA
jgi:hypothetical protein